MEQTAPKSFLDLPAAIRRRIYCTAGLVTNTNIHVSSEERKKIHLYMELKGYNGIPDLTFSLNLLITCRAIYKEVSHLLSSSNCFCTKDPQCLYQLPPSFISSLSSLKFCLVAIHSSTCCGGHPIIIPDISPTILDYRFLFERWENTIRFISPQIKAQTLNLSLICDVYDEEMACLAVKPLRYLPTLSGCEIRLSHRPNNQLSDIARKAALHALEQRSLKQPPESFPFLRLPREIQLEILEFPESEQAAIEFFTNLISSHALHNLRSLEIRLYYPDFSQWMQTVQRVKDKLINLQYLFLLVSPSFLPSWPDFPNNDPYPRPTLAEERGIDIVRESVDFVWPVEQIGLPNSAIRLFFVEFRFKGTSVYYYKRREHEHLPTSRIYIDLTDVQSVEVHIEREVCSDLIGDVDGGSLTLKTRSGIWIEGILAHPDQEAYEEFTYG
ncbi:hypothetical protein F4814DRAFT_458824 [Daldinia grandis]|nr:hypothetical protein F4814DRAFT_458824 [Daldinia grandis]